MPSKLAKHPLRILIATHAPLSPEYGAAQMALNLGQAFQDLGHHVTLWSPHPVPKMVPSFKTILYIQDSFQSYLKEQPDFDIIDCPPFLLAKKIKNKAFIVCRSVQPDLLYALSNLNVDIIELSWKDLIRFPFSCLNIGLQCLDIIRGWLVADRIFCLGTHEFKWMQKWFPFLRKKLLVYYNALSAREQEKLKYLRRMRLQPKDGPIKFLWIGRWVNHKGIAELTNFIQDWLVVSPQDSFTIAGCGDCCRSKTLLKLSRSERINIIPHFSRQELFHLLANHHIGLFTSRVEGWGLCLNEMLESGMPVFATRAGGVEDLQSVLADRIKPFPPTLEALLNTSYSAPWPVEYYQYFTWEVISKQYLKSLMF